MTISTQNDNNSCNCCFPLDACATQNTQANSACITVVALGRMVTSSRQITKVEQRRARLVLGYVTAAGVTLPAMCRGVGQASHITLPLSTQQ